ncbi:MAG: YhhA family cyclophane-containing RiPP [Pseudomonadota bacterium]
MRNDPIDTIREVRRQAINLDLSDSVALKRLIDEVRQQDHAEPLDVTLYNRTYHRHNR